MQSIRFHLAILFAAAALVCALLSFDRRPVQAQAAAPAPAPAAGGKLAGYDSFKSICSPCHTIGGGKLLGPDLKGLKERVPSRDWAIAFVRDPKSQNDDYAKKVRGEFNDLMTAQGKPQGTLDDAAIADIIDFIFAGGPGLTQKTLRKANTADIEIGRMIFTGEQRLQNGAPACVSCHSIAGIGGLGGGTLASNVGSQFPDLTNAFNRNGGEAGVRAALAAPQFLVMKQVFADKPMTEDEVIALTADLGDAARKTQPDQRSDYFIIYGLVGAIVLLLAFDYIWIKRFTNVRKTLVGGTP